MIEEILNDFYKISKEECVSPENILEILKIAELKEINKKLDFIFKRSY